MVALMAVLGWFVAILPVEGPSNSTFTSAPDLRSKASAEGGRPPGQPPPIAFASQFDRIPIDARPRM